MTTIELYMGPDNSSGTVWTVICVKILVFARVFRFQALEPVFTPCTDQGCVLYVYKLSKCLEDIWVIYMYICARGYRYIFNSDT